MDLGRQDLTAWTTDDWTLLDDTVKDEVKHTKVYPKLLNMYGPLTDPWATSVPADTLTPNALSIPEGDKTILGEVQVRFSLSNGQVMGEGDGNGLSTAVTLATRAANLLALGMDTLVWDSVAALPAGVQVIQDKAPQSGLVSAAANAIQVFPTQIDPDTRLPQYEERTFDAVAAATAKLESLGHPRPFGFVVDYRVFADTFRTLPSTLITPAERIIPLVTRAYCPTARVPAFTGLVSSSRASTVDFVVGLPPTIGYLQKNEDGTRLFKVFERFAVRLKDPTALVRLEFQQVPRRRPESRAEQQSKPVRAARRSSRPRSAQAPHAPRSDSVATPTSAKPSQS
jgi:uncharacterized linocin/CFP29 family protein